MSNFEIGFQLVENEVVLVGRLQVGSEEAFEALIHLYQTPVYNIAYRVLGDPAEAADAVQETFLKVFKGIRGFRGESGLKTWIYRIAISVSLNRQRWWKRWKRYAAFSVDGPVGEAAIGPASMEMADPGPSPESYCASREVETAVQKALGGLVRDHRIVIILRDIEGLSYEEIADTLGLSLGTVKSRLWRGRLELKKSLQSYLHR